MLNRYWLLEERAETLLAALGIEGWFRPVDTAKLARWLRPWVKIRRCQVADTSYRRARSGAGRILVPDRWQSWYLTRAVLHEFAHPLLDVGMGEIADIMAPVERRQFREAVRCEEPEERLADEFVLALRLPARLVLPFRDCWDPVKALMEATSMPAWPVIHRWRQLDSAGWELPKLDRPPRWSAAAIHRLEFRARPEPVLWVCEQDRRAFCIPAPPRQREGRERRLKLDLAALRPVEFRLKYARYADSERAKTSALETVR